MKPYPNYKGNNLTDIIPRKIAFVTEGANKKRFCLFKLKTNEGVIMKKETALALVKAGTLSDSELKLVLTDVADADRAEVQSAIDGLKKSAEGNIDMEKLALSIADKIVKSQEKQLTAIAESLKSTTVALEKLATPKTETNAGDDKELTDAEIAAAIEAGEVK